MRRNAFRGLPFVAALWLCLLAPCVAPSARAQTDKATAEALFDRGLTLLRAGQFTEACARLEQSQAIDRGIGTMLYLADCYERIGRTASAWALFREASSLAAAAGQAERAQAGRRRAEQLEHKLSTLTVRVSASEPLEGLTVLRNGQPVPENLWGLPLPVDPGEQLIEARAPGTQSWSARVSVKGPAGAETVSVPELARAEQRSSIAIAADEPALASTNGATPEQQVELAPRTVNASAPAAPPARKWTPLRIAAVSAGAAGLVLLGVGAGYGVKAVHDNRSAERRCPEEARACSDARGVALSEHANDAALLSNILLATGGGLLAAGVVAYLVAPSERKPSATQVGLAADPRSVSLNVRGGF